MRVDARHLQVMSAQSPAGRPLIWSSSLGLHHQRGVAVVDQRIDVFDRGDRPARIRKCGSVRASPPLPDSTWRAVAGRMSAMFSGSSQFRMGEFTAKAGKPRNGQTAIVIRNRPTGWPLRLPGFFRYLKNCELGRAPAHRSCCGRFACRRPCCGKTHRTQVFAIRLGVDGGGAASPSP